ncbi:MAG: selenoneine biosynthesis selenosugar synthase SenB [Vulcanimicrobiaceae bacterium]
MSPAPRRSRLGNAVTARRYADFFASAGWQVRIAAEYDGRPYDALIAIHARRSGRSALRYARAYPDRPLVVVLSGTDLYRDLPKSALALRALASARTIVSLQPDAIRFVPRALRSKCVSIVQSAAPPYARRPRHAPEAVSFCVVGHLRREKDPLRAAYALRHIARDLDVHVVQIGGVLDERYAVVARRIAAADARYEFLGELSAKRALQRIASSDALVISSRMEGVANVVCEAIACGTPVLASRISGNVGLLGKEYAGYFQLADARGLAALMRRYATQPSFARRLREQVRSLQPLVAPEREREAWLGLIRQVV